MTAAVPLCVDLDGTLIRTDSLAESIMTLAKNKPWHLALLPFWLLKGRAAFKEKIAAHGIPDAQLLPYDEVILADLRRQHAAGRPIVLATAAHAGIAHAVSNHLGIFSHVFASDGKTNLKSRHKAARLTATFGERQFDYIGDSSADIPVWKAANHALLARRSPSLERSLARSGLRLERVYEGATPSLLRRMPKVLRLHQWMKNALIFVPIVTSLSMLRVDLLLKAALAFFVFGLCASSVYVINDLLDLPSDRRHPRKRLRPFASGDVSPWFGLALAPALLFAGAALAWIFLPPLFGVALATYIVITFAYSIHLKGIVLVDVMVLAILYTLRIIAGAFAVSIEPTFWLLAFSMFVFLSLALIKRFSELQEASDAGVIWIAGRGYKSTDIRLLMSLGTSAGYIAVLVLALYINSDQVRLLYARPQALWMLCPLLLYWIARMWMQAERGNMHDDPLVFAAKDRVTAGVAVLGGLAIAAAAWVPT